MAVTERRGKRGRRRWKVGTGPLAEDERGRGGQDLSPKMAVPMRTRVEPEATARGQSADMPIESSVKVSRRAGCSERMRRQRAAIRSKSAFTTLSSGVFVAIPISPRIRTPGKEAAGGSPAEVGGRTASKEAGSPAEVGCGEVVEGTAVGCGEAAEVSGTVAEVGGTVAD